VNDKGTPATHAGWSRKGPRCRWVMAEPASSEDAALTLLRATMAVRGDTDGVVCAVGVDPNKRHQ
jgi:hypothetical protein